VHIISLLATKSRYIKNGKGLSSLTLLRPFLLCLLLLLSCYFIWSICFIVLVGTYYAILFSYFATQVLLSTYRAALVVELHGYFSLFVLFLLFLLLNSVHLLHCFGLHSFRVHDFLFCRPDLLAIVFCTYLTSLWQYVIQTCSYLLFLITYLGCIVSWLFKKFLHPHIILYSYRNMYLGFSF